MALFNSFTFDGINSLANGIFITGEAVFDAPERVVEMITVPGRNGEIAMDQGRFENIEVKYPAGCYADSMEDFADKIAAFRNELASRYTYKRLTDSYNPDEFRLGLYKSGLSVGALAYNDAGEFDVVFNCKMHPCQWVIELALINAVSLLRYDAPCTVREPSYSVCYESRLICRV